MDREVLELREFGVDVEAEAPAALEVAVVVEVRAISNVAVR
jgi:hypothetical protein